MRTSSNAMRRAQAAYSAQDPLRSINGARGLQVMSAGASVPLQILLIEDDEGHASIIERSFARYTTFALTIVSTITDGAAALARSTFDLVIADWRLPDGDAFDLLKRAGRFPLLILTSHGSEKIAVDSMKAGALDYVVKSQGSLSDMPRLAESAIRLWTNIVAKEAAQENLRQALNEKTVLLKEVHHRVKNNLQVVGSLLSMQIDCSADGSPAAGSLQEAHSRVVAMSLIHEHIYRSESLAALDFTEYISTLSEHLFRAYCIDASRIRLALNVEAIQLTLDEAVPCGLVLNELLSNSLKHAFRDGRQGVIRVSFTKSSSEGIEFIVSDNGVGLPAGFRLEESSSLGLQVVRTLTRQLRAALHVSGDDGTTFRLNWQMPERAKAASMGA
jgi:two-component sensor histidine kinase